MYLKAVNTVVESAGISLRRTKNMKDEKTRLYKITWEDKPDENGNKVWQSIAIRRHSLLQAVKEVCEVFEISEQDIIKIEKI